MDLPALGPWFLLLCGSTMPRYTLYFKKRAYRVYPQSNAYSAWTSLPINVMLPVGVSFDSKTLKPRDGVLKLESRGRVLLIPVYLVFLGFNQLSGPVQFVDRAFRKELPASYVAQEGGTAPRLKHASVSHQSTLLSSRSRSRPPSLIIPVLRRRG